MNAHAKFDYQHEIINGEAFFNKENYEQALQHYASAMGYMYEIELQGMNPGTDLALVKEKIKYCNWYIRDKKESNSHLGCVLYHIQRFDLDMVADLLDDDRTYMDVSKGSFLNELSKAFSYFNILGDTYLNREEGYCNSRNCHYNKKGYSLIGNESKHYLNLIFVVEHERITDIFDCTDFKCGNILFQKHKRVSLGLPF